MIEGVNSVSPVEAAMLKKTIDGRGGRVVLTDSITKIAPEDSDSIVIAASHGGTSCGDYALKYPMRAVVFNDAGVGKKNAGIASLAMLDKAGVIGATVSYLSARIGEVEDMWANGIISHVNTCATKAGLTPGTKLSDAITRYLEQSLTA
jgi:hypothetical protein